ncbi:MAG: hypothetical protein BJBARM5_0401 [Candidatus Parvarchaeum acidophilus ARMAN-5]|uniref:40-residue YVTN family beta-propeller repeat protein n=1 Tax=Candidatus Parvarchaeum acidophilus ARMAN-5 TaxID=662762 RepID=D6GV92_PARA5|nr:MAG: hypothetical protein BJBARM5_0401 [Candidatus Parvarchaeum acidophilus ARMAN-5]
MLAGNRSQSALEYMMTYGWAILIIVIVAVILYSMGIFNPASSASFTITGFSGFSIQANCVAGNTLVTSISNLFGYPLELTNAKITLRNGSSFIEPLNYSMTVGGSHTFFFQHTCPDSTGSYFADKVVINGVEYNSLNSPLISSGTITGKVGSITPYQVLESISVEDFPTLGSLSKNGYYLWQPNQANSSISIINIVSNTVVKTLTNLPTRSVVFSKNGQLAFIAGNSNVASPAGTYMIVLNTSNYKVVKNITGLCDPQILTLSPGKGRLFIPGYNYPNPKCTRFLVLNTSSLNIIQNVSQDGLAIWSASENPSTNQIYLVANNNNTVEVMSGSSYSIVKNLTDIKFPEQVVYSPNGQDAYIAGKFSIEVDASTLSIIKNLTAGFSGSHISSVSITNNGKYIFGIYCGSNNITVFDTTTNTSIANITLPTPDSTCTSYANLNPTDSFLYVAETTTNKVFLVSV